jgi:hypothetical protein
MGERGTLVDAGREFKLGVRHEGVVGVVVGLARVLAGGDAAALNGMAVHHLAKARLHHAKTFLGDVVGRGVQLMKLKEQVCIISAVLLLDALVIDTASWLEGVLAVFGEVVAQGRVLNPGEHQVKEVRVLAIVLAQLDVGIKSFIGLTGPLGRVLDFLTKVDDRTKKDIKHSNHFRGFGSMGLDDGDKNLPVSQRFTLTQKLAAEKKVKACKQASSISVLCFRVPTSKFDQCFVFSFHNIGGGGGLSVGARE